MAAEHVADLQQEDEHERTSHGELGGGIRDGGDLVWFGWIKFYGLSGMARK
ncbi:hypothetical protein LLS1_05270 [Leifsonia sp. LS1]|nr:hypothetical protein LLS1_05270 [Leifsonia sp. LS1]